MSESNVVQFPPRTTPPSDPEVSLARLSGRPEIKVEGLSDDQQEAIGFLALMAERIAESDAADFKGLVMTGVFKETTHTAYTAAIFDDLRSTIGALEFTRQTIMDSSGFGEEEL